MAFISALSPWLHRAKESPLLVGAAVLVVVGGVMLKRFLTYKRVEAEDVPVKGNPADPLTVYVPRRLVPQAGSSSSFGTKILAYLRFLQHAGVDIKFTVQPADFQKAPKGKMPYIKHGDSFFGDTELIFRYISNTYSLPATLKAGGAKFAAFESLKPDQQATSTLVTRLTDEHLYWGAVYYAWVKDAGNESNWLITTRDVLKGMPAPLIWFLGNSIRRDVAEGLRRQGVGRHSEKDMLFLMDRDLAALSATLGSKQFINGSFPCDGDCSMYAILDTLLHTPRQHPLVDLTKKYQNLVDYADRIRSLLFSDIKDNDKQIFTRSA